MCARIESGSINKTDPHSAITFALQAVEANAPGSDGNLRFP